MKEVMNKKSDKAVKYTIGQAAKKLRENNPTISISKIRYLEDEGLISVSRSKGGYRQYSLNDIARLAEILRLQQDYFLPLQVIKKKMSDWSAPGENSSYPPKNKTSSKADADKANVAAGPIILDEALKKLNLAISDLQALENYGLVNAEETPEGKLLGVVDFQIMKVYKELTNFGIEPRHLRIYENFSNKEINLFSQILAPHLRHKSKKKRDKTRKELEILLELTDKLQKLLRERAFEQLKLS